MMKARSLKWRIINVGIMTEIITLILVVAIVFFVRRDIREDIEDHNIAMTESISSQVKLSVELPLKLIQQIDTLIEGDHTVDSSTVTSYMEAIVKAHSYFREIHIVNYEGILINTAPYNALVIGNSLISKPYFTQNNEGKIIWSEVFISDHTGRPTISITIPEDDYIIVVDLDLDRLPIHIDKINHFEEVKDVSIVDQWGTYIYTEDMNDVYLRNTHPLYDVKEPERTVEKGISQVVFKEIEGMQWYVAYTFDMANVYASINRIMMFGLLFWCLYSLITIGSIMKLATSTNNGLVELQLRTHDIIGGDYTVRSFDFLHLELIQLAEDFGVMSREIQDREETIKGFNQELELMVHDRTLQLEERNTQLREENQERTQAEMQIREINDSLDQRIAEKTFELEHVNRQLVANIIAVEDATKAKSQFLAVMSHEMRTPLNGIIGFIQMLDHASLTSENSELLEMVSNSSQILLALINDILDVSKYEADKGTFSEEVINAYDLMHKVVGPYSRMAKEQELEFEVDLDALDNVWIKADSLKLNQLVSNLLNNALKFTTVGYIKIKAACHMGREGWHLELKVEDSGIGIRDEVKPYLFNAFAQADESITRDFGGTGLGLTICREIAEYYQGTIEYSSLYGVGTEFTINMILEASDISNESVTATSKNSVPAQGDRILVVEDNEVNRKLMVKFLGKYNKDCDLATNGEQAVAAVLEKDYDIIFMDCHMPVMDGIEATRTIRSFNEQVQIYAMTAYASKEEHDRCIQVGMDGFFTKPVDLNALAEFLGLGLEDNTEGVLVDMKNVKKHVIEGYAEVLYQELGFDMESCIDLIETYVEQAKGIFVEIQQHYGSEDIVALSHKLHQLKGASGAVRISTHRRLVEKAEELVGSGRIEEGMALIKTLREDLIFEEN